MDLGNADPVLDSCNVSLRYAVHDGLSKDLACLDITEPVQFDFSKASIIEGGSTGLPHKAELKEMENVQIVQKDVVVHSGRVDFIYDDLADAFLIWWADTDQLPDRIWNRVDLGVRRRLQTHAKWKKDAKVLEFASKAHERPKL